MNFSDTSNKNGLIQEAETLLFGNNYGAISGNQVLLDTFTRYINTGLDVITTYLLGADGRWQFDDSNYTDLPIGLTTLVNSQQDYRLDTTQIKINAVELKDAAGDWYPLKPMDQSDIRNSGLAITDFHENDGKPIYYDVKADTLFLYPAPDTTQTGTTNSLKVYFQRVPSYFVSTDTTKKPGFASIFHDLPVLYACSKYAKSQSMTEKAREYEVEFDDRLKEMVKFFSERQNDEKLSIKARPIRSK